MQEQQVDVRLRRQFAAAVTAQGHQGEAFAFRGIGLGIDRGHHVAVDHPDQLVDQVTVGLHDQLARGAVVETPADLGLPEVQGVPQTGQHRRALGVLRPVLVNQRLQLGGQNRPVEDRPAVADPRRRIGILGRRGRRAGRRQG